MLDWVGTTFQHEGMSLTYTHELILNFGTMFCICMVCHGELVRLRPDPRHLTEFYLMLSAGGALGGVAVSLAAPHLFKTFLEWNIGMLAAYAMAAVVLFLAVPKTGWLPDRGVSLVRLCPGRIHSGAALAMGPGSAGPRPIRGLSIGSGISTASCRFGRSDPDLPDEHRLRMKHGAIPHGQQFVAPEKRHEPLTYYTHDSGIGRAILELQKRREHIHVGVVGLGVGTLACYARPGDHFTFYEINPAVRELAEKVLHLPERRPRPRGEDRRGDGRCPPVAGAARAAEVRSAGVGRLQRRFRPRTPADPRSHGHLSSPRRRGRRDCDPRHEQISLSFPRGAGLGGGRPSRLAAGLQDHTRDFRYRSDWVVISGERELPGRDPRTSRRRPSGTTISRSPSGPIRTTISSAS